MPVVARFVFRDQVRHVDAAYVIEVEQNAGMYTVYNRWGSWNQYRNGTLASKRVARDTSLELAIGWALNGFRKRIGEKRYIYQYNLSIVPDWAATWHRRYGTDCTVGESVIATVAAVPVTQPEPRRKTKPSQQPKPQQVSQRPERRNSRAKFIEVDE